MSYAYSNAEARKRLLDAVAAATNEIAVAIAALGAAYEQLDEASADRLESELFRPVQVAYGRAQRAHAQFAGRCRLPRRKFVPASAGLPSAGAKALIDRAVDAVDEADRLLVELQDSLLPVEVGDLQLRADLQALREALDGSRRRAREVIRVLGR